MSKQKMKEDNEPVNRNARSIEYFYKKNRFINLLKDTQKHKDLWKSKEALYCFILALVITFILVLILFGISSLNYSVVITEKGVSNFLESIRPVILTILGGFFSLLGFTISGLALLTGTIGAKVITKISEEEKIEHLMSVIFNFYFCGVIIGATTIISILTYIITFIQLPLNLYLFCVWAFIYTYLVIFSITYSVMLLGTCIRLFLLQYFYMNKSND
ncbi:hypothetical protein LHW04_03365 [Bacillus tropicus]|uniref:hypothetical protein n=1 Tax=Bacillus cereus group TaxID=86661 RepID=UPI001CFEC37E|nr:MULTISPECIES: hypothetical protein [Bacillus cereus group]MCB4844101.1 hypothetical protein [Bacillus tropicus]